MVNKQLMKRVMPKKISHKVTPITSIGKEALILPNYSGIKRAMKEGHQSIATLGSVLFSDGKNIAEDNNNLFWYATRKELWSNLIKITSDGTQMSPALKFNDTNTGFFKVGDSIRLSLNNSTKVTFDSTGVGIGKSPTEALDVVGNIGFDGNFLIDTSSSNGVIRLSGTNLGRYFQIRTFSGETTIDFHRELAFLEDTTTERMRIRDDGDIDTTKVRITVLGGIAIKLTNKTGANSVAGQLVQADTANNDAVKLTGIDEEETIGVFYESGVSDGSEAWVVISGIADVAMEDDTTATRGNWVRTSITEAGYADATNAAPPSPAAFSHFNEIGNCIETVTATGIGTHILARCVLHFN